MFWKLSSNFHAFGFRIFGNIVGFIDHTVPSLSFGKYDDRIMDDQYQNGYIYGGSSSYGYEIIYFKKKKKFTGNVTLQTDVSPAEAKTDGCSVTPSGGTYSNGDIVTLTAASSTGWVFDKWSGDVTGNANPTKLTLDGDKAVTGNFKPQLLVGFNSEDADYIEPPHNDEKVKIGTVDLTAYGVDWQLRGLDFLITTKVKAEYAGAFISFNGKKVQGTIHKDDDGYMTGLNFAIEYLLPEGSPQTFLLYFMFDFPPNEKGTLAPLDEIKELAVSFNRTEVTAEPVIAVEGVKIPESDFVSEIQTIGWIWNISYKQR